METKAIEKLAAALMDGVFAEAKPWEVGAAVTWIADALGRHDSTVTVARVRKAAKLLNDHLLFEHTRLLAQTWRDCCEFDASITKHHAQALIELSAFDTAEQLLRDALAIVRAPGAAAQAGSERLEYEGLLGRLAKQRYVATLDKDSLVEATGQYLDQYNQPSHPYWHGINAVALVAREQREGVDRGLPMTAAALAEQIYAQVTKIYATSSADPWVLATASEASMALGECDQAEFWLYRLLHHPEVRPFHVNSYERQIREIWQGSALGGGACADRLAGILARHLVRTQSRWSVATGALRETARALEQNPGGFEKNFSGEGGFDVDTIKRMLAACASIGCVTNKTGERLGTGFLIDGAALNATFPPAPLFVTNAHVISDTVPNAIRRSDARVTFEIESTAAEAPVFYKVSDLLFTSPPGDSDGRGAGHLDVTIVRLDALPPTHAGLSMTQTLPLIDAKTRAYVVGHPRGSGLQISLHDSLLLDIDDEDCLVHYRTPTDPGSSGSPVFNKQWEVIAVHHSGSSKTRRLHGDGHYEANEGIALSAVCRTLTTAAIR